LGSRNVATANVASAYLHADLDNFTLLKMKEGNSVDIMCDVCEEYTKFVCYEHRKTVLCLQGGLFRKFWEVIMGHKRIDTLKEIVPAPSQERVEERNLVRNRANGRKTDTRPLKPITFTYADRGR
jgi:hypothetical protein